MPFASKTPIRKINENSDVNIESFYVITELPHKNWICFSEVRWHSRSCDGFSWIGEIGGLGARILRAVLWFRRVTIVHALFSSSSIYPWQICFWGVLLMWPALCFFPLSGLCWFLWLWCERLCLCNTRFVLSKNVEQTNWMSGFWRDFVVGIMMVTTM